MHEVYLLLGSNLGDREEYLKKARNQLKLEIGSLQQASSLFRTEAWGKTDQPDFINQALLLLTSLTPQEILNRALSIEKHLGRERSEKWGARVIDIDILFYDDAVINEPNLIVPHPHFHERRFAIEPMLEISPDFIHPGLNKTIKSIALELNDR